MQEIGYLALHEISKRNTIFACLREKYKKYDVYEIIGINRIMVTVTERRRQNCYFLRTFSNFFCLSICLYLLFHFLSLFLSFLFSVPLPLNLLFFFNPFCLLHIIIYVCFHRLFGTSCYILPYLSLLFFLPHDLLSVFFLLSLFPLFTFHFSFFYVGYCCYFFSHFIFILVSSFLGLFVDLL